MPAETKVDRPSPRPAAAASRVTLSAPDWLKKPDPAGRRHAGASVALSRTCGSVFATPERVRAHHPHPVRAGLLHEPALGAHPARAGIGEPATEHDKCLDALGQQESMT